jgi:hypothetical protein
MRLPILWLRATGSARRSSEVDVESYVHTYRAGMVGVEVVLVAALMILVMRLFPGAGAGERGERLLVYLASTIALWPLLYDRLDLAQAMLVQVALSLLVCRVHYAWPFLLLSLAIHFKLIPIALIPVFLIGSMPAATGLEPCRRTVHALTIRTLVLSGMVLGILLPYYALHGAPCLEFLVYHRNRGLEIHSLYSSLLMGLHETGFPVAPYYSHGCVNLGSSLSPFLSALAPRLMVASLLAVALLCWTHFRELARRGEAAATPSATLAQLYPRETVSYALLALLACAATNKVLSSQYLLWLAPLVPLVSLRRPARWLFQWSFVVCCVLTTALFPYLFTSDLARPLGYGRYEPPTHRAIALLIGRNLLLLGLAAALFRHLWKSVVSWREGPRPAAPCPPTSAATAAPDEGGPPDPPMQPLRTRI